ncbi:hypothetical protein BDR04DRAFT_959807, partial [Suillus decipiens]
QLVPHHGIHNYAKTIPNGSMEALWHTIISKEGEGGNAVELDPLWIAKKPYVMHDLTGDWQSLFDGPCS